LLTAAVPRGAAGQEGVFSLDVSPDFRGEVLARFADKELKADRAAILVDDSRPVCTAVAAAFVRKWRGGEKKIVQSHSFDSPLPSSPGGEGKGKRAEGPNLASLLGEAQVLVFAGTAKDFARARAVLEKEKKTPQF